MPHIPLGGEVAFGSSDQIGGTHVEGLPSHAGAEFSEDRAHRFLLWRSWSYRPLLGFVMLNPSTANETCDDPTTTRNMERARRLNYGGIVQANLYSFRTKSPAALKAAGYPGAANEDNPNGEAVKRLFKLCQDVVFAWGAHARVQDAGRMIITANCLWRRDTTRIMHLGRLKNGQPRHPLMTGYGTAPDWGLTQWL